MEPARPIPPTESSAIGLLAAEPILGSGYFRSLAGGSMAKVDFVRSQLQFFHAVGFSRAPWRR